jgi:signal transduction histidine kinase
MFRAFIFLLFLFVFHLLPAQSIVLKESGHAAVKGRFRYWRDDADTMTIDAVRKMKLRSLDPHESPNFGFDQATYWFRLDINNQSQEREWLLEISYAPLDQIDFYMQSDSGDTLIHKISGDMFPIGIRDIPHRHPVFTFDIERGMNKPIYLRVKSSSSMQIPMHLWHNKAFIWMSFKVQILNGLFYGAMLIMVLYQLFLFFFVRDKITFYYVFTLLSMANIVSFFQGYNFLYLYPGLPMLNDFFAMFSGPIFVLFSTLLTHAFLNLRQFSRWLDDLLMINMLLNLMATVVMVIFFREISYKYHHYFILVHCIVVLSSAGYCLYKKYRPALYYLLAWVTLLTATTVFTLSNLGLVPGYMSTNYIGVMLGCILQMLFISFALGERWNVLIKENQKAKELELQRGLEENERLEREVKLRTQEILLQKDKLEEAHRIKDKLFSVVSHDIKSPLNSLKLALTLSHSGHITPEEFKQVTGGLEAHLGKTTEFIQNLLQWAKLQLNGAAYDPVPLDLLLLVEENKAMLELETSQKKINIKIDTDQENLIAYADPVMIRSVFRNLLTNALKFTPTGGTITLGLKNISGKLIISVSDTGVGIAQSHQARIFTLESVTTLGTQQEAGTGLGLVLCKEFVEKNGGRIWFESEEGKGTIFYFSLLAYRKEPVPRSLELKEN